MNDTILRKQNIGQLQKAIGYAFINIDLLSEAITHSSAEDELHQSNERLEFLGDAVLELVVSEYLFKNYKKMDEGIMTKTRAGLVYETTLYHIANDLNLGEYLVLGRGEENSGGRQKTSILADAVEAIVGALYLDGGFSKAKRFILTMLEPYKEEIIEQGGYNDYKTRLQEILQSIKRNCVIKYLITGQSGPDHAKLYDAAVSFEGQVIGVGQGKSKKDAEQAAAQKAIEIMQDTAKVDGEVDVFNKT